MLIGTVDGKMAIQTFESMFQEGVTGAIIELGNFFPEFIALVDNLVFSAEDFFQLRDHFPPETEKVLQRFELLVEKDQRVARDIKIAVIDIQAPAMPEDLKGNFFGFGQKIVVELRLKNYQPPKFERPKLVVGPEQFRVGDVIVESSGRNKPICYNGIVGEGGRVLYYPGHHGVYGVNNGLGFDYRGYRLATAEERRDILLVMSGKPVISKCPREFYQKYMSPQFVEAIITAKGK